MPDKKTLIFDTETTGLPTRDRKIRKDPLSWPRLVEIGWIICSQDGTQLFEESMIIIPEGFAIPEPATKIHGITTEEAKLSGVSIDVALDLFCTAAGHADYYVAHNLSYDIRIILSELIRKNQRKMLPVLPGICTMRSSAKLCAIPGRFGKGFKWPSLSHLHTTLFNAPPEMKHRALSDACVCADCYHELRRRGVPIEMEDSTRIFFEKSAGN